MDIKPTPWPLPEQKLYAALVTLVMVSLSAFLGLKAWNEARQHKFIGVPIERNTITIDGEGKATAIPDIALLDLGMTVERPTVSAAQKENTRVMNEIIAKLKAMGVDGKDIQTTNYSIYPSYDYLNGRQQLRGYTVAQSVKVKVRKLDNVSDILGAAGQLGANQIGGISFSVDEPEKLRQEARLKALKNAKEKAEALADVMGVELRRVVSFSESSGGSTPPMFAKAYGLGGGADMAVPRPEVEAGSTEVVVSANVTYEIE
ncbi:SIMPL domain-containing protein [Candidatus Uhrbacteria bacterium]|nr:SIMPL domain-containing protein [Candidatus Uhrbacteria bacterium]